MNLIGALLFAAIGVPIYDWMMLSACSGKVTSFDYEYWPLTRKRKISVAVLAAAAFFTALIVHPPEPDGGIWKMIPVFVSMGIHGFIACEDVFRQRKIAHAEMAEEGD